MGLETVSCEQANEVENVTETVEDSPDVERNSLDVERNSVDVVRNSGYIKAMPIEDDFKKVNIRSSGDKP